MWDEIKKIREDALAQLAGTSAQKQPPYKLGWYLYRLVSFEFITVFIYRLSLSLYQNKYLKPFSLFIYFIHKLVFKVDMHPSASVGGGLQLVHGFSIVIGAQCIIGENVAIFDGVSLGKKNVGRSGAMPIVGNNVILGSGAKLLGAVKIADNCIIGANSVVISSFEKPNTVIAGVPATALSKP